MKLKNKLMFVCCLNVILVLNFVPTIFAKNGEALYKKLYSISSKEKNDQKSEKYFISLIKYNNDINWNDAEIKEFSGHIRYLQLKKRDKKDINKALYLIRTLKGEMYILAMPSEQIGINKESNSFYRDLKGKLKSKLSMKAKIVEKSIDGKSYRFARFIKEPHKLLVDRLVKLFIILTIFFVMVGMGMSLTIHDFRLVFRKPKAMIIGPICQFGILPLIAMSLGILFGFNETQPFIFVGLILIASSPAAVTSNLMTFWSKGDLALSVSVTAVNTVLSLFFTPFLLTMYTKIVPNFQVPVKDVVMIILVLLVFPLFVGLIIRRHFPNFAQASKIYFSALGAFSLIILIIAGIVSNRHLFGYYDYKFYLSLAILGVLGLFFGGVFSKLFGLSNYQTRALVLETGIQNCSMPMTIGILLQDKMGDFHSSMFATAGMYALWMYPLGVLAIWTFNKLLPFDRQ